MPKIVDHHNRKVQIAEATWKVIVEEGLEQATVRKIAQAAGLSVGSLRHYFPSQSDLILFSMELVTQRVKQRTETTHYEGSPLDICTAILCELLPVDKDRRIEMEVWFVFSAKTLVDPNLKELSDKVYHEMHHGLRNIIDKLYSLGLVKENLDPTLEVNRLHTLVDGMALHHLIHPTSFTYDNMIGTLKYHLQTLCK